MAGIAARVFDEALSLPADARLDLIEKLLASLNLPIQEDIEQLWEKEAERRIAQIDSGDVDLVPGKEVFSVLRDKYAKR